MDKTGSSEENESSEQQPSPNLHSNEHNSNGNGVVHDDDGEDDDGDDDDAPFEESGAAAKTRFIELEQGEQRTKTALVNGGIIKKRKKRGKRTRSPVAATQDSTQLDNEDETVELPSPQFTAEKLPSEAIAALKSSVALGKESRKSAKVRSKMRKQIGKVRAKRQSKAAGKVRIKLSTQSAGLESQTQEARNSGNATSFLAACIRRGPRRVSGKVVSAHRRRVR